MEKESKEKSKLLRYLRAELYNYTSTISFADYDEILEEAKIQGVSGLIAHIILQRLADQAGKFMPVKMIQYKAIARYTDFLNKQYQLTILLESQGIRPIFIKGISAGNDYPNPALRLYGDIDFLVVQDFKRAKGILCKNGYYCKLEKNDFNRHAVFVKNGVTFEMHRYWAVSRLFSHSAPKHANEMNSLIKQWCISPRKIDNGKYYYYALPVLQHGIVLLQHMNQHIGNGLGLRQIIDWMMYVERNLDDTAWDNQFEQYAMRFGLKELAITTSHMCSMYLGLESKKWFANADESLCSSLMEYVLMSGDLGRRRQSDNESNVSIISNHTIWGKLHIVLNRKWHGNFTHIITSNVRTRHSKNMNTAMRDDTRLMIKQLRTGKHSIE